MFNQTKATAKITDQDPVFKARYVGNTETYVATGKGCTMIPVQKLWDNSDEERYLKKVSVTITTSGIFMKNLDKKKDPGEWFKIENISFCNADTSINERLFSWIHKEDSGDKLRCHALLCSSSEKAKAMALVLSRAFQIAYKEWQVNKTKEVREIEKTARKASIAKVSESFGNRRESQSQTDTISESASSLSGSDLAQPNGSVSQVNGASSVSSITEAEVPKSRDTGTQASVDEDISKDISENVAKVSIECQT